MFFFLIMHLLFHIVINFFFFNLIVCAFFSLAPVLKAISVGGRATSHSYLDQEGLRAGLTTFTSLWTSASSLALEPAP